MKLSGFLAAVQMKCCCCVKNVFGQCGEMKAATDTINYKLLMECVHTFLFLLGGGAFFNTLFFTFLFFFLNTGLKVMIGWGKSQEMSKR